MHRSYGFISPKSGLATTLEQAVELATSVGFPVALKISSPDILHKVDVGGVVLGCRSAEEVRDAYNQIMASVTGKAPSASIQGISVEEMVSEGREVIIGVTRDPQFGLTIMFGLGGVFVEILKDVSFRVLPITRDDAVQMIDEIKGRALLEGYRGQPPVSREMLIELLMNTSRMAMDLQDRLEAIDFNPIAVWGDQHRVLDAKVLLKDEPYPARVTASNTSHLEGFFSAKSVALIGASASSGKVGNSVLDSLANHGYHGKVFPVNPTKDKIMGIKTYPSLSAIPDQVAAAVVTVGLPMVPDIIDESATKGVRNLIVLSGGGKELGGDSLALEETIKRKARETGTRIVGCNCIGVYDSKSGLDTMFQGYDRMLRPKPGPIAVLTQSGTVGIVVLEALADVGVSKFVSYGNRIDVDEADLIAYLADDPDTRVIAIYIEGLAEGRKLLEAARALTPRKPIVVFKSGRSQRAARASMSHTGFFGGSYEVTVGAFRQAGIIAVNSIEELCAAARALAMQPRARGPRVSMISNGAGTMVQAMDLMEDCGLELMPLADATIARLKAAYPPFYLVQNPVDVTGSACTADYDIGIQALMEDPNVDVVMPWFVFQDTALEEDIVDALGRIRREYDKPLLVGTMGGPYTDDLSRAIQQQGVPVYRTVKEWVTAARALVK